MKSFNVMLVFAAVGTAYAVVDDTRPANADFIDCTHKSCQEWTCKNWCHCYEEKFDEIYAFEKCVGEDTCNCGEMDNAPVVVAPHSYKLLQGTACTGRNELPSQPDINLAQAKRHCDGISSCVSFEMALCDASGNCNFNFSTTCVESTSNGNYHNFDLYIKE